MTIERLRPSFTFTEERLRELQTVVPEAFADGKINWDVLREAMGEYLEEETQEHFGLTWPGKRDARRLAALPSEGTLVPVKGEGIKEDTTRNIFIEGENLEVLKLLHKSYASRVKTIYIDPPYNTGNDFIYEDDFSEPLEAYLKRTGQTDSQGRTLTTNTRASGRFHSRWLSMMYARLLLASRLLRDDGVILVSIDDGEVHHLRQIMGEIFGEENFVATVIWQKVYSPKNTAKYFSEDHDYIVIFAKRKEIWQPSLLPRTDEMNARYGNPDNDPRGPWKPGGLDARNYYSQGLYSITCPSGRVIAGPPPGSYWRYSESKFQALDADNRIWWGPDGNSVPSVKRFLSEVKVGKVPQTLWAYAEVGHTQEAKQELMGLVAIKDPENVLNTLKPTRLLRRILQVTTSSDEDDIVMDFFSGSAPAAQAVMEQNRDDMGRRSFVLVQYPEPLPKPEPNLQTIADIGKERIRSVIAHMKLEGQMALYPGEDFGFRVLRLNRSNFRRWHPFETADLSQLEDLFSQDSSPLESGWEPEGLLTEIMLLEGFPLDSHKFQLESVSENVIWRVGHPEVHHELYVCLDQTITPSMVDTLKSGDLVRGDNIFICLDSALSDEAKVILDDRLRLKVI
jgi:adenine-specific DNA-methyltransferase